MDKNEFKSNKIFTSELWAKLFKLFGPPKRFHESPERPKRYRRYAFASSGRGLLEITPM